MGMTPAEATDALLAALQTIEPATGYLVVGEHEHIEEDLSARAAVTIDGWMYRDDLERIIDAVFSEATTATPAFGSTRAPLPADKHLGDA